MLGDGEFDVLKVLARNEEISPKQRIEIAEHVVRLAEIKVQRPSMSLDVSSS